MANIFTAIAPLELFIVLIAGILPALIWLWFWLKEDNKRPEPRNLLILSFFAGALVVLPVILLESYAMKALVSGLFLLIAWAFIEEVGKFAVAYLFDLRRRTYDEPIDAMIYLITVAIGFAAFENVLFLIKSLGSGGLEVSLATAAMRFLGATLLHVFSSSVLGGFLAISFCDSKIKKRLYTFGGLIVATLLHTLFNFFIMSRGVVNGGTNVITVFTILWIGIIFLLLFFEKVKTITCKISESGLQNQV